VFLLNGDDTYEFVELLNLSKNKSQPLSVTRIFESIDNIIINYYEQKKNDIVMEQWVFW